MAESPVKLKQARDDAGASGRRDRFNQRVTEIGTVIDGNPFLTGLIVFVDTREQRPFLFATSERTATGDYSVKAGDEDYRDRMLLSAKP